MQSRLDNYPTIKNAFEILNTLFTSKGFEIRMAGGAVRDICLGEFPTDVDFATTATPEQMITIAGESELWDVIPTGIDHGTVTFMSLYGSFEVTTLRKDIECDGRHAVVEFTDNWKEDAARRDFTFNAMFMDIDGKIYDYFGGFADLMFHKVRFVGDPNERIKEDALRMIRYGRFFCKFQNANYNNCEEDLQAIIDNAALIKNVSVERIWQEWKKVCQKNPENVGQFLKFLQLSGLSCELNFPSENFENVVHKLDNHYISFFPAFALATQCSEQTHIGNLAEQFKLSRNESDQLSFFIPRVFLFSSEFDYVMVQKEINNGTNREWLKAVACFLGRRDLEALIDKLPKYVLPVTGQDLLDAGIPQGPKVGTLLKIVKEKWDLSHWSMQKEELLDFGLKYAYDKKI